MSAITVGGGGDTTKAEGKIKIWNGNSDPHLWKVVASKMCSVCDREDGVTL